MTETGQDQDRQEDLRRLLTDAIEVQLAALKAGISFWTEWIEQTGEFVSSATKTLASINSEDQQAKDVLLELVDAGRASMRSMTEIPRHSAMRFIEELDRLREEQDAEASAARNTARKASRTTARRASKKAAKTTAAKASKTTAKKASKTTAKKAAKTTAKAAKTSAKKAAARSANAPGTGAAKKAADATTRTSRTSRPRRAGRVKS
ncbi:hypothetical protein BH23GEM9_BH23GEM9_19590 [soil metagenome]